MWYVLNQQQWDLNSVSPPPKLSGSGDKVLCFWSPILGINMVKYTIKRLQYMQNLNQEFNVWKANNDILWGWFLFLLGISGIFLGCFAVNVKKIESNIVCEHRTPHVTKNLYSFHMLNNWTWWGKWLFFYNINILEIARFEAVLSSLRGFSCSAHKLNNSSHTTDSSVSLSFSPADILHVHMGQLTNMSS